MNLDIIYIKDLKNMLSYADVRSVCDYCRLNNMEIFGTGKRRYVLAQSFKRSQLSERIKHLKGIYGNAWVEVLKSEFSLCAKLQSALDEIEKDGRNKPLKQMVKTKGKAEQGFLLDIKKVLS